MFCTIPQWNRLVLKFCFLGVFIFVMSFIYLFFFFFLCWIFTAAKSRLSYPSACWISLDQGLNLSPCVFRWILNHWTTGKSWVFFFLLQIHFLYQWLSDWSVQISMSYWFCLEMCLFLLTYLNHWHIFIVLSYEFFFFCI